MNVGMIKKFQLIVETIKDKVAHRWNVLKKKEKAFHIAKKRYLKYIRFSFVEKNFQNFDV